MHQPNTECMYFEISVLFLIMVHIIQAEKPKPKASETQTGMLHSDMLKFILLINYHKVCLPQYARGDVENVVHVKVRTVSCAQAVKT